ALLARGMPPSLSYAVLLGSALLVSVIVAPLIERGILRFMYAKDEVVILLITYALFLILEDVIKMIWGVNPYFIAEPYGLLGSFDVLDLTYPYYNLILVGVAIACGAGLAWMLGSTRTGKLLVAVTVALAKGLVVLGLVILLRCGLVSFGQALYYCIGAYSAGMLGRLFGASDVFTLMLAGMAAAGLVGFVLGFLLARYRSIFFG